MAAIQFQYPLGCIIQKIAVMGHAHHRSGKALQKLLQPLDRLGIQVVGRLIQQQHVGLAEQQLTQGHPTLFAARQILDLRLPRG